MFATLHIVGSGNATRRFPGRSTADDQAAARRTDAAVAWLRETFASARASNSTAAVLIFHAEVGLDPKTPEAFRRPFAPVAAALGDEVEVFPGEVLVIHGDGHDYVVDHPMRTRGARRLPNFTRMQVPGSPMVGWVRVVVTPGQRPSFAFEPRVVPRWKFW